MPIHLRTAAHHHGIVCFTRCVLAIMARSLCGGSVHARPEDRSHGALHTDDLEIGLRLGWTPHRTSPAFFTNVGIRYRDWRRRNLRRRTISPHRPVARFDITPSS